MATDKNAIQNNDPFEPVEMQHIQEALKLQQKSLQRKINTENNPEIRQIYQRQQADITILFNKLFGVMK